MSLGQVGGMGGEVENARSSSLEEVCRLYCQNLTVEYRVCFCKNGKRYLPYQGVANMAAFPPSFQAQASSVSPAAAQNPSLLRQAQTIKDLLLPCIFCVTYLSRSTVPSTYATDKAHQIFPIMHWMLVSSRELT